MTITLTPDTEQSLVEEAQETGKPPEQLAVERLRRRLPPATPESALEVQEQRRQEALARVKSGYYAELLGHSTLSAEKKQEVEREEQRWQ